MRQRRWRPNDAAPPGAVQDAAQPIAQDEGRARLSTWMGRFLDAELRGAAAARQAVYNAVGDDTVHITADRGAK